MLRGRKGFNGLLTGQGTAGVALVGFLTGCGVSMASSSAKALPVQCQPILQKGAVSFNGLLIGQGTAGL